MASKELVENFPLLPHIEARKWQQLLEAEAAIDDPGLSAELRAQAIDEIERVSAALRRSHPFSADAECAVLGSITYRKASRRFEIPARVSYPVEGDTRHPGELEVVLCSNIGRIHETLFVTAARPLHLELLMHLNGYRKSSPQSKFRVTIRSEEGTIIPVEELIAAKENDPLPNPMIWSFAGSDFSDLYAPDQTGDFLICWHAHDSVLQIDDRGIASGETKLLAAPHDSLKQGSEVTVILSAIAE